MSENFVPKTPAEQVAHDEAYLRGLHVAQKMFAEDQNHDLIEENQQLRTEAELDAKTKLKTYPAFKELIKKRMAESEQSESTDSQEREKPASRAIAILDLDDFKNINLVLEYQGADDICLIPTAAIISDRIGRAKDMVAETGRFGGEEFVVFLDGTDLDGAIGVVKDIRSKVNEIHYDDQNGPRTLGVSAGVASFGPNVSYEDAFSAANQALQRAKEIEGKNQIVGALYAAQPPEQPTTTLS